MKDKETNKELSFRELVQIAQALNRSEAALRERYKRLLEQAEELLPRRQQQQHLSRGTNREQ
jgi:hypothetical protein